MSRSELIERISIDPKVMFGKPVIKGTRLTLQHTLGLMGNGASIEEILGECEGLKVEDIQACFMFAAEALDESVFFPGAGGKE